MSNRKKVSFGSKNPLVETWIIDDADVNPKRRGDVRELISYDLDIDTMTSACDNMVAQNKASANHKISNRHVTIGDTTFVVMGPEDNSVQPDNAITMTASDTQSNATESHENIQSETSNPQPMTNTNQSDISNPANPAGQSGGSTTSSKLPVTKQPGRRLSREPQEEYYNVLEPQPKDQTLESRDNPFLPGGDLSREAEDLLSRATIIRDHFYLNEEEKKTLREQQLLQQQQEQNQQQPPQKQPRAAKHVQIVDHHDGVNGHATSAVEERIAPQTVSSTSAAPPSGDGQQSPKENGKASDSATGASSTPTGPDSVHVTIPDGDGQPHNTSTTGGGPNSAAALGDLQVQDADKKRRNKCCAVM